MVGGKLVLCGIFQNKCRSVVASCTICTVEMIEHCFNISLVPLMDCNTKRRPHVESIDGRLALQWQPKNDAERQQHFSTLRTHCHIFEVNGKQKEYVLNKEQLCCASTHGRDVRRRLHSEEDFDELDYSIFDIRGEYISE